MKITNKYNLPRAFVEMATEEHIITDDVFRVTSLLQGVRATALQRRYRGEIEQDVSDMIWLLFGKAVHHVLEVQKEGESEIKEERLNINVGDYTLSGQFDLYCADSKKITDYKTASVWKIIYGDYEDWKKQLLIYAWMMKQSGFEVNSGEVVALLKDHSKRDAKMKPEYPKLPVAVVRFDFAKSDFDEIEVWIRERIALQAAAESIPTHDLPECTPEERWNTGDKYAVMKKGRKTALRVLDSMEAAAEWLENSKDKDDSHIEIRFGEDKKCMDYCSVNAFCDHYKKIKECVKNEQ
jgi:hypothetical protein